MGKTPSLFAVPPLTVDSKRLLPRPHLCLYCNLPTWSKLPPNLRKTIVSLSLSTIACWRRWRRRLTTSGCGWGLTSRASQNHLPMKRCSSSLSLVVDVGWKILYFSVQPCVTVKILFTNLTKNHIVTSSFRYRLIGELGSCFYLSSNTILALISHASVSNSIVVWKVFGVLMRSLQIFCGSREIMCWRCSISIDVILYFLPF